MRRTAISLLCLLALACTKQDPPAPEQQPEPTAKAAANTPAPADQGEWTPGPRKQPEIVREDLLAVDLPPVPTLDTLALEGVSAGSFEFAEGSDELVPRVAVVLGDGLLLAGQAYLDRHPGRPSTSWRWLGFTLQASDSSGAPSSTKLEPGAIRDAVADGHGGALLCGASGIGFDMRGWFGVVDERAQLGVQAELESTTTTEMFDVMLGASEGELATLAGYVDAQGWVVSLGADGQQRWQKFVGSYGYTQPRAFVRLDGERGDLLLVGTRAKGFGESWWAKVPGDGGDPAGTEDIEQDKLSIDGADQHQMLRAIVDVGEAGFIALGTAKRNHVQAHDQPLAVGFDRAGVVTWTKVLPELRVSEVLGARAKPGAALFVVEVPGADVGSPHALALLELNATGHSAQVLDGSAGWSSTGFVEGADGALVLEYGASATGIKWRSRRIPGL